MLFVDVCVRVCSVDSTGCAFRVFSGGGLFFRITFLLLLGVFFRGFLLLSVG